MEEIGNCVRCGRSHNSVKLIRCVKTKELLCKDCCVKVNGNSIDGCGNWKMCWLTFFV